MDWCSAFGVGRDPLFMKQRTKGWKIFRSIRFVLSKMDLYNGDRCRVSPSSQLLFSRMAKRDNETRRDIEKWQSAPVFCTGCFESDATIRGRIVFVLAIIQGLKTRDEVGRLDRRYYIAKSRIRVKK